MTKLSKQYLDPKDFGLYVNNLWSAFILMETKDDVKLLFKDIFTHTEYKMFAKRLEIARRLLDGQKYDQISNDLRVTQGTIAQISNTLAERGEGYKKVHSKLKDIEKNLYRKREGYQKRVEHRLRPKLATETFLADAIIAGSKGLGKIISKRKKLSSIKKQLDT